MSAATRSADGRVADIARGYCPARRAPYGYPNLVEVRCPDGVAAEEIVDGLRPLLELPVEYVLATHGGPFDGDALERALSVQA